MSAIPPSASLNLPPVTMSGKYVMEEHDSYSDQAWSIDELPTKQGYYLQGNYLRCVAEVSSARHCLLFVITRLQAVGVPGSVVTPAFKANR